jgi:hypothetical protein
MSTYSNIYVFDCFKLFYTVYFFYMIMIFCIVIYLQNILFHNDDNHMYIAICDWEFTSRVDSPHTSKYNYGIVEEMNKNIYG